MQTSAQFQQKPAEWPRLLTHLQAIAFTGLPQGYLAADWHMHPREFFGVTRACRWLSANELALILPRYPYYDRIGTVHRAHTTGPAAVYQVTRQAAHTRLDGYALALNRCMRKYDIQSTLRQSHFIAQTILETDRWRTMREYGSGAANPNIPMAQYYAAFYGRGMMQLTWLSNYRSYGVFRENGLPVHFGSYSDSRITANSIHWTAAPGGGSGQVRWAPRFDADIIASNAYNACDSGGFYWVSKAIGQRAVNINAMSDRGAAPQVIGRVSVLVNGGGNGYGPPSLCAVHVPLFGRCN